LGNKIPKINNLQRGKDYLGSQFQTFHFLLLGHIGFGPVERQYMMAGMCARKKLLIS
jgi:hypothetical protein